MIVADLIRELQSLGTEAQDCPVDFLIEEGNFDDDDRIQYGDRFYITTVRIGPDSSGRKWVTLV